MLVDPLPFALGFARHFVCTIREWLIAIFTRCNQQNRNTRLVSREAGTPDRVLSASLQLCATANLTSRRKRAFGVLSARGLGIVAFVTASVLAGNHQACAQAPYQSNEPIDTWVVQLATLSDVEISDICARDYVIDSHEYDNCVFQYEETRRKATSTIQAAGGNSQVQRSRTFGATVVESISNATSTFAPTLSNSTATLPFLGNWLTVLSWVPNSSTPSNTSVAYAVGLAREPNCSLNEDYVLPGAGLPDAEAFTSLPNAQDFFHKLAGLTTTPDVFTGGCAPLVLGLHASNTALYLGQTPTNAAIGAQLASAGLYVTITDLTANTVKTTQVTSGSNPGAFYAANLRNNGIMDLIETGLTDPANSSPATAVLLGNGDGTFQKPVYYDVSANSFATAAGFTVDDVNGDGIPDIVILNGTVELSMAQLFR